MMFLAMRDLPADLQEAIGRSDLSAINLSLSEPQNTTQEALNACLDLAMSEASNQTIELLLQRGAVLSVISHGDIYKRDNPAVFRSLIDTGWDVNSTDFELSAVQ
jgi:hypothetical protein